MKAVIAMSAAVLLSACASASGGSSTSSYSSELDQLQAQCTARGGMLQPNRRYTGQPPLDYACVIHDGASERLTR